MSYYLTDEIVESLTEYAAKVEQAFYERPLCHFDWKPARITVDEANPSKVLFDMVWPDDESLCDFYIFPKNGHTTCWVTIFEYPETSSKTEVFLELHAISTAKKSVCYTILGSLPPDFYMGVNKHALGEKLYCVIDKTRNKLKQRMLA